MDLFAIHACEEIKRKWSARMGKMTLRVDDLEYARTHSRRKLFGSSMHEANLTSPAPI